MEFASVFGAIWLIVSFFNIGYVSGANHEAKKDEKTSFGTYVFVFIMGPFASGGMFALVQR